jgi:hypothetical protein
VPSDGENDRATGSLDLLGELDTGRRCSDDENATFGELLGVPVIGCGEAVDSRRDRLGNAGRFGRWYGPLAMTTALARHSPLAVRTRKPSSRASTDVTSVCSSIGASIASA